MNRTIEVIVFPSGKTKLETKGFKGSACREASRFLEEALGARASETLSAEFYQQQASGQSLQEGQGALPECRSARHLPTGNGCCLEAEGFPQSVGQLMGSCPPTLLTLAPGESYAQFT